jgi:hypothetical protein
MDKILKIKESPSGLSDSFTKNENGLRGKVVLKDELGNVLFTKWNLIVLRGRVFALESMFGVVNTESSYRHESDKQLLCFGIGTGGALEASPFNPVSPGFNDRDLANRVPFMTINSTDPIPNGSAYPVNASASVFSSFVTGEEAIYKDPRVPTTPAVLSGETVYSYYLKKFDAPTWHIDTTTNETYLKAILNIGTRDARGKNINELGLYFTTASYTYPELFSRITFHTESLATLTKNFTIEYYIYA